MKIFDAHTHAFPKRIAQQSIEVIAAKADVPHYHAGDFDALMAYEKQGGADAFLLLPIATKAKSVRSINEWVAGKAQKGVLACGTLHPEMEDFEAEADRLVKLHLRGVKLHPEYQGFFVDDERVFPLYEAVFDRGLAIYFHAGEDLGYPPPVHGDARRIARVAQAFPKGRIVAAHMGAMNQYETVLTELVGRKNVWMDTSFAAQRMKPEAVRHLIRSHGADKFFFGTDAPWARFEDAVGALTGAGLDDAELQLIFWDNAARFFHLTCD